MTLSVKDAGVWKTVAQPYVKHSNVWKQIQELWTKQDGVWKLVFTASVSYNYQPGDNFGDYDVALTSSGPVVFTWSKTGTGSYASPASGTTSSSLYMSVSQGTYDRTGTFTVSANDNGTITNFTFYITTPGSGGGGGGGGGDPINPL